MTKSAIYLVFAIVFALLTGSVLLTCWAWVQPKYIPLDALAYTGGRFPLFLIDRRQVAPFVWWIPAALSVASASCLLLYVREKKK